MSRVSLPVSVDVSVERLPAGVEATAYFVVSEALTNVVKHAQAAGAAVTARVEDGELRVEVRDDGVGGARGDHATGLGGLEDRVSALGGRLVLESPRVAARAWAWWCLCRSGVSCGGVAEEGEDGEDASVFGLGWVELELVKDAGDVFLDCGLADQERLGDAVVRFAFGHRG